jgi:hypothetical protein
VFTLDVNAPKLAIKRYGRTSPKRTTKQVLEVYIMKTLISAVVVAAALVAPVNRISR